MFRVRLRISRRHALSQTRGKARVRRCSIILNSSSLAHLRGTSRHSCFHICSGESLLIRGSGYQKFIKPLSDESMGGDCWIPSAAVPAALDGHPPDVHPILFSHTCCFRGSSTMGTEDGPFCQLFGVGHRTDTCQGHVGDCIQRSSVRPTRSVRSARLAAPMARRAVHRSAFSGKQVTAAYASFATTALRPLRNRFYCLAMEYYHWRSRPSYSNMVVG